MKSNVVENIYIQEKAIWSFKEWLESNDPLVDVSEFNHAVCVSNFPSMEKIIMDNHNIDGDEEA